MAQKVEVKFIDDLDGSEASGTVSFSLDGRTYEIDLSEDNAARLRDSLATFVAAARRAGTSPRRRPGGTPARNKATPTRSGHDNGDIRTWARQNGHEVSERGRIPKSVIEAYQNAH